MPGVESENYPTVQMGLEPAPENVEGLNRVCL